jgi:hypothetical protein
VYVWPLPLGVYGAEEFGIKKLGAVCVYPCLNMLVVVCCDIPKVVHQLWKWFTGWVDGFGIVTLPADVSLVYGLVCAKLTAQEEEGLMLLASSFFSSNSSINICNSSSVFFACLSNIELIID